MGLPHTVAHVVHCTRANSLQASHHTGDILTRLNMKFVHILTTVDARDGQFVYLL